MNSLKYLREAKHLTITQLSRLSDISRTSLYRWETEGSNIPSRFLPRLIAVLGCSKQALCSGDWQFYELNKLAAELNRMLEGDDLRLDDKPVFWRQDEGIRALAKSLSDMIDMTHDINKLHESESPFTKSEHDAATFCTNIPELDIQF